jgi:hypothetical protein
MPVERQRWAPAPTLDQANAQLKRTVEVFDASLRTQVQRVNATATLALTWPHTLVESDTTAGAVVLTFPAAATVPGFRIDAVKTAGANVLTVNSATVTTYAGWISTGVTWRRVS